VVRIADQTGASVDRIAGAFAAVRDSFGLTALNTAIQELDGMIAGAAQLTLFVAVQNLLLDRIVWFLRNVDLGQGLAGIVAHYQSGIGAVADALAQLLPEGAIQARAARWPNSPRRGAGRWRGSSPTLRSRPPPTPWHRRPHRQTGRRTAGLFRGGRVFPARSGRRRHRRIKVTDYFDRLALDRALDAIRDDAAHRGGVLASGSGAAAMESWVTAKAARGQPSSPEIARRD
jgi:glutamate dehydrogenase